MTKRRFGFLIAWLAATTTATILASQAVALVRDQVTDRPSRVATTLALETTTSTADSTTTSFESTPRSSTSTTGPGATTTAPAATTSSTRVTVTTAPTGSTTSTIPGANQEETLYLTGGWATVRCSGNDVALVTYAPNPGYKVEIKSAGPAEVRVEFEEAGGEHESKLEAGCSGGALHSKTGEHDDD